MPQPTPGTYPSFFSNYVSNVETPDITEAVNRYGSSVVEFFKNIPAEKATYRYAEGKWSLKEMLQHIIDTERIFAYRALTIARQDTTSLPGFDENWYASHSNADTRNWEDLLREFEATRKSTDYLITSFTNEQLSLEGITSNATKTVNAICFTIYGHILHHINVVKERYL